jgi:hypothetical protein
MRARPRMCACVCYPDRPGWLPTGPNLVRCPLTEPEPVKARHGRMQLAASLAALRCDMLSRTMARDLNCVAIHGDKSQVRLRLRVGSVRVGIFLLPAAAIAFVRFGCVCRSRWRCISILRRTALARVGAPIAEL